MNADILQTLADYAGYNVMMRLNPRPIISGIVCYDIFEDDTHILYNKTRIVSYRNIIHIYRDIPRKYSIFVDDLIYLYSNNRGIISYNTVLFYISLEIEIYNCDIYEYKITARINPTSITFIAIILYHDYMNNPEPSFTMINNEYRANNKNLIKLFQNRMRLIKKMI